MIVRVVGGEWILDNRFLFVNILDIWIIKKWYKLIMFNMFKEMKEKFKNMNMEEKIIKMMKEIWKRIN